MQSDPLYHKVNCVVIVCLHRAETVAKAGSRFCFVVFLLLQFFGYQLRYSLVFCRKTPANSLVTFTCMSFSPRLRLLSRHNHMVLLYFIEHVKLEIVNCRSNNNITEI